MKVTLTGDDNIPAQVSIVSARADRGDVQNAELFARLNLGRLLHIAETGDWLKFYLEAGWLTAANGEADRAAKAALAELAHFAGTQWAERPDDARSKKLIAHVEKSHALPRLRAMIELSKSEPGMTERLSNFDADPWLLGVNNGVLNLKTGALTPMSPNVLVSKRSNAAFDPDADCPLWEEFLRHVQPDPEMQPFLRRLCGYFLSGVVAEHIFPFLSGGGGNGKGVFVETIAYVIGEYAVKIETAMLMEHKRSPQSASPDIMKLRGARLAFCSETSEGQRLDAERVKEMTGGDTLTARPLYGNPVSFQPSHKLMMMGNYKPEVSDMSAGMWRRVLLIPFAVDIPKGQQDTRLPDKLKHEASGILNWMLFGLRDWRNAGLQVPESVSSATNAYRDENDIVGEWIREECKAQVGRREAKDELYNSYCQWCESNGHMPTAKNRLTRKLTPRGFVLDAGRRNVIGLRLKTPAEKAAEKTAEKAEVDEAEEFAKTSLEEPAAHMASALDPPQGLGPS
jgi:putative DNA primase/helicase